ncbi:PIR protein [Plasmodium brasilianum]|uniref:PIR protein n=1 Tax=Plasmodium brasilianum TaxID=5824 RepID=UPI00350E58B4|nr:PIR protein [Plasmodium brasilianum]
MTLYLKHKKEIVDPISDVQKDTGKSAKNPGQKLLYSYDNASNNFNGQYFDSNDNYCIHIKNSFDFFIQHYDQFQKKVKNFFCKELNNFKEIYNNIMCNVTSCPGFTPMKSYLRNRLQKEKLIKLKEVEKEAIESPQNTHYEEIINYERSFHNIGYQPQLYT